MDTNQVRCPKLSRLRLHNMSWGDGKMMEALLECLRTRQHQGAPTYAAQLVPFALSSCDFASHISDDDSN
ncbi:hypothetical protein OH77DRAFT_1426049 [Trametes cingulata]|nr:hypothetical protein OH77DRAFT_1426049 [Trametes cingulata]